MVDYLFNLLGISLSFLLFFLLNLFLSFLLQNSLFILINWLLFFLFVHNISLYPLLCIFFMFLYKFLILLFLLFGRMIKLAIFSLSTKTGLNPKFTWFFHFCLMYKRTILLNTSSLRIISTNLSFLYFFHYLMNILSLLMCFFLVWIKNKIAWQKRYIFLL